MKETAKELNLTRRQVYSRIEHLKRCAINEELFLIKKKNGRISAVNIKYIQKGERAAIKRYDEYYMTLEEIAHKLGIGITQVRAIEQTALAKLKNSKLKQYMET
jgi:DNA-directed RNA polymerase specialized sigma subunit